MKKIDIYDSLLVYIADWKDDLTENDIITIREFIEGLPERTENGTLKEYTHEQYRNNDYSENVINMIEDITGVSTEF